MTPHSSAPFLKDCADDSGQHSDLACGGTTDMRRGFASLSGFVQSELNKKPLSGQVFLFRGRRGDLVKLIWHDGDGTCLLQKRLDLGRFIWPQATSGAISLTRAQLIRFR